MSEESYVPVSIIMGHLSWCFDLSKYAILLCFIPSNRRHFFVSIDIFKSDSL